MTAEQVLEDLRSLTWLPYTFELDDDGDIIANGDTTLSISFFDGYIYVNGVHCPNFCLLVGVLIQFAPADILKTYLQWAFTEFKIDFAWQNEEKTRAIISREGFAYCATIEDKYLIISQGYDVKHAIPTICQKSLYDVLKTPREDEYESIKAFYNAAREFKRRYARECPLMRAQYKATITRSSVVIASISIDIASPTEYDTILYWERQLGIADAVKALPQPIAEEIAPHLI